MAPLSLSLQLRMHGCMRRTVLCVLRVRARCSPARALSLQHSFPSRSPHTLFVRHGLRRQCRWSVCVGSLARAPAECCLRGPSAGVGCRGSRGPRCSQPLTALSVIISLTPAENTLRPSARFGLRFSARHSADDLSVVDRTADTQGYEAFIHTRTTLHGMDQQAHGAGHDRHKAVPADPHEAWHMRAETSLMIARGSDRCHTFAWIRNRDRCQGSSALSTRWSSLTARSRSLLH